jgi:3-oxoacyl-[acyl-carrier protein] reductase
MDLLLAGKVALVSAGSQGIGRAIAEGLHREGARVAICARDAARLEAAAAEIGEGVLAVPADLNDPDQIANLVAVVERELGPIEILINNAGGPPPGTHEHIDDSAWQAAFRLTLQSAVRLTDAVLPGMKQRRWGRVINVSSYSVKQPLANMMLSNSLRLAVLGWAKTLSNEVAPHNILVNTVCPGWTNTGRVTQLLEQRAASESTSVEQILAGVAGQVPLGRVAEPEEIAALAVFLASPVASYITGTAIAVDGGAAQTI